ncbi:MAG: uroporphyrinogen-III synthase [Burkholderiales bacterium]|jgi:uroporphyrinogen-III synthase|nr:uroporphyrinogen-III synthase [Burkholderiales bacterium]
MRVVVTRPAHEAAAWREALAGAGHEPVILPLIDIAPVDGEAARAALAQAWAALTSGHFGAVMCVSGNAVAHFMAARPEGAAWPAAVPAWSPGPGTTRMLRGVPGGPACVHEPAAEGGQFDSEHLWENVHSTVHAGVRVLCLRGGDAQGRPAGRDWLAARVREAGGQWEDVVAYRRLRPAWTARQASEAAQALADVVWLFSSSEAVSNLQALLPGQSWRAARAIATHPRIAQAARDAGFGRVRQCLPTQEAVVASIESPQ